MPRNRGIDPYEWNNADDENIDMKFIAGMSNTIDEALEAGRELDDFVDTLYELGFSPEAVDVILHTRELNEGNWN